MNKFKRRHDKKFDKNKQKVININFENKIKFEKKKFFI